MQQRTSPLVADGLRCECTGFCSSRSSFLSCFSSHESSAFLLLCSALIVHTHVIHTLVASYLLPALSLPKDCSLTLSFFCSKALRAGV
eukprot:1154541-Pelagomonas_calceolata.AAC.2